MSDYLVAHWRGQLALLRSCFPNGVAVYALLVAVSMVLSIAAASSQAAVHVFFVIFVLWVIWAGVGIIRCGARNARDRTNTIVRRIGGLVAVIGALVTAWMMATDVYHLAVRPLLGT